MKGYRYYLFIIFYLSVKKYLSLHISLRFYLIFYSIFWDDIFVFNFFGDLFA